MRGSLCILELAEEKESEVFDCPGSLRGEKVGGCKARALILKYKDILLRKFYLSKTLIVCFLQSRSLFVYLLCMFWPNGGISASA